MGLQTGVSGVCGEELEGFLYRLLAFGKPFIGFELVKLCPGFTSEEDFKQGRAFLKIIEVELGYFAGSRVFKPPADALQGFPVLVKPGFRGRDNFY